MIERWVMASWYGKWQWTWVFWPLSLLYGWVVSRKYQAFIKSPPASQGVPVIVVGNITAGGTGKTPVVQALARELTLQQLKVGVITRGYGGSVKEFPHVISQFDSAKKVGDEPLMLAQSLNVPVVVDPVRRRGIEQLKDLNVDVIISDDGLQHYGMHRDIEVCVVDAQRQFGNSQLIPVGPLREPKSRTTMIDYLLFNGAAGAQGFLLEATNWVNLKSGERVSPENLDRSKSYHCIAGIGNPTRFFDSVRQMGIKVECDSFPDHHQYQPSEFEKYKDDVLMTEKDAVKVKAFASDNMWYLQVIAQLPQDMLNSIINQVKTLVEQNHG